MKILIILISHINEETPVKMNTLVLQISTTCDYWKV